MIKSNALVVLVTAAAWLCAQDRMRPGLWENTVTSGGKSSTRSHCITQAELATTNGKLQAIRETMVKSFVNIANGTCTLKDLKIDGNSMTSLVVCADSSFAHTTIFHGDTVETTSTSTKAGVSNVSHITSRRLGVCP
jgi:hypothetical protein